MALHYTHFVGVALCCDAARRCSRRSTKKRKSSRRDAETQREEGEFSDLTGAMPSPRLRGFYFICLISLFFSFSLRLCVSARDIFLLLRRGKKMLAQKHQEEKKLAQRRRDAEGRRRIFRFNRRNAFPKAPRLLFHLPDFSLLLFFSAPLRLCARYLSPGCARVILPRR